MNIPKEIITEDGYKLTYSHSVGLGELNGTVKELTGFINVDTLFEMMEGLK